jgi:hypothetical protein
MLALPGGLGYHNVIINGCGWIDQRNNNAAVTVNSTANTFGPDRWAGFGQGADGVFTLVGTRGVFDSAGAGTPSSIYATTTTADASIGATQIYAIRYCVEGQDVAAWRIGTAQAALATLSFRVLSTKTGTHCVAITNDAVNRSYVATYTIPVANTWQQVIIPIQMDTTGTWLTTNAAGIRLFWNLGCGSTLFAPAANAWQAGQFYAVSGAQNVIDTLNAVFAITDVQFELGGSQSPFEHRPFGAELALCQRYYESGSQPRFYAVFGASLTAAYDEVRFAVTKRAVPIVTPSGWQYFSGGTGVGFTPTLTGAIDKFSWDSTGLTNWNGWAGTGTWAANAEL